MERFTDEMVRLFGHDRHFVMIWQWVRDWGGNRLDKKSLISNDACRKLMDDSIKKGLRCHEILSCQAGTDTCEAMYKSGLVFNFDGNVYKCAMRVFNADEHKKNCVGKLLENGNIVFDKGIEAQWLLPTVRQSCYSCVFFPLCMGNACPFTMVYRNEHTCIVFKNLIPDQMKTMYLKGNYTNFEVIESAQDRKKLTEIFDEHGITIRNEDEKIEADSLVYISIIVDIEDQFDLQIPDDFLYDERLLYFSDFVSLVNELTKDQCSKEQ